LLDYQFNDIDLLREALTHRSKQGKNNERLEYLGDAIVGFLVAEQLFLAFPTATEGQLSRSRSKLVKGETLAKLARNLNMGDYLRLGPGEMKSGGYRRNSTLADAYEAVIGALYLDGGVEVARRFVVQQFTPLIRSINLSDSLKDSKTKLQEWLQSQKRSLPVYTVINTDGGDHEQIFKVQCEVEGLDIPTIGEGASRRKAEQAAAKQALAQLTGNILSDVSA
jgi:ribonuclease-3